MIFIELTPFVAFRERHWTDETFAELQRFLLAVPDAGDLIRGSGGLRKVRWRTEGRGKKGGTVGKTSRLDKSGHCSRCSET
jgi:hypothetical protein